MRTAACTIVAKNYLSHARVLMNSIREQHPEFLRFVVLADKIDGYFDPKEEPFEVILSTDISIHNAAWFHFNYTMVELCTALKPWVLETLLERYQLQHIIYLDSDIRVYLRLDPILRSLMTAKIALTPHLVEVAVSLGLAGATPTS